MPSCLHRSLSVEHVAQLEWQQKSLRDIFASYAPFLIFSIYFKIKGQYVTSSSYSAGLDYNFFFLLFLLSEEILHWSGGYKLVSEWACWQGASGHCSCGRGDMSCTLLHPLLAATASQQCQQQGMCPCTSAQSTVPQLAVADSWLMPDHRQGQGRGTWSLLQFPGVMVTSACLQSGFWRKAMSASLAGLGLCQWQRQLQLLQCHSVHQPWVVLAQGFAGLSRMLGSDVRFLQTDFCPQFALRPSLNLQLTVPVVLVIAFFVNSWKCVENENHDLREFLKTLSRLPGIKMAKL